MSAGSLFQKLKIEYHANKAQKANLSKKKKVQKPKLHESI